jgi:hypothetical protein
VLKGKLRRIAVSLRKRRREGVLFLTHVRRPSQTTRAVRVELCVCVLLVCVSEAQPNAARRRRAESRRNSSTMKTRQNPAQNRVCTRATLACVDVLLTPKKTGNMALDGLAHFVLRDGDRRCASLGDGRPANKR